MINSISYLIYRACVPVFKRQSHTRMYLSVHEAVTPYRSLLGNAAWTLMHTAPYNASGFSECELDEGETRCTKRAFAIRVASMVASIIAAYPCTSCRTHANVLLASHAKDLKAYAQSVREEDAARTVEDEIAIRIFRMHNAVSAVSSKNPAGLEGEQRAMHERALSIESKTLAAIEAGMDRGSVPRSMVAQMLRIRWKK